MAAHATGPASVAGVTPVALERHSAGTFYVDGAIQGFGPVRMLVDTGSSHAVISEAMLEALKQTHSATYLRETRGVMADGTPRGVPIYKLAALRVGASCWVRDIEAAVIPGQVRPILGMNVLARLAPFTFSADPAELRLQQCQAEPVLVEPAETAPAEKNADAGATE